MSEDRMFYAHFPPFKSDDEIVDELEEHLSEKVGKNLTYLERRITELKAVLAECAEDLESEIESRYALIKNPKHQDVMLRYEEDMTPIRKAKRLLGKYK